jgi:hypothetical protein
MAGDESARPANQRFFHENLSQALDRFQIRTVISVNIICGMKPGSNRLTRFVDL